MPNVFEERAQVMVNFFDSIQVLPGLNANGSLTLGENIADHGGLQVSFQAFQECDKRCSATSRRRIYSGTALPLVIRRSVGCNIRDEQIRLQNKV